MDPRKLTLGLSFSRSVTVGADRVEHFARATDDSNPIHFDERAALDARLLVWSASLTPTWLAEPLTYTSKIDSKIRTVPKWALVTHTFNHQTHHRGQVTTLLSQLGLDIGSTDIPFMPEFGSDVPA